MTAPTAGFELLHEHQYPAYVYLLGLYLGDGGITHQPRTYRLLIYLNKNTPRITRGRAPSRFPSPGAPTWPGSMP